MPSTAFIICLILAAVMMTVHPFFAVPFGIAALVITPFVVMKANNAP